MVAERRVACACERPEEWLPVTAEALPPSLRSRAGTLEVSSWGRIRRAQELSPAGTQRPGWGKGMLLTPQIAAQPQRSPLVYVTVNGASHGLALLPCLARIFHGPPPPRTRAIVRDGDMEHRCRENVVWACRNSERVAAIRAAYDPLDPVYSKIRLAQQFGVSLETVQQALKTGRGKPAVVADVRALYDPRDPKRSYARIRAKYGYSDANIYRLTRGMTTAYMRERNAAIRAAYDPAQADTSIKQLMLRYNLSESRIRWIVKDLWDAYVAEHAEEVRARRTAQWRALLDRNWARRQARRANRDIQRRQIAQRAASLPMMKP